MKPVTQAYLHSAFFIPGVGTMKDVLPSDGKTLKNFKMNLKDDGQLLLSWEEGKYLKTFTVGAATVKGVMHVPEELKPSKKDALVQSAVDNKA